MKLFRLLLLCTVTAAVSAVALPARAVDTDALRRKQEAQQRARGMARELVASILDIQLQQLEENGLKELPLYREIQNMKKNMNGLVEKEMKVVVELLVKGQQGTPQDRDKAFKDARRMIREIVMRLSIERQNLLRRLKTAELTAQVKRLIDMESRVLKTTKSIPDQPQAQQEKLALSTIEDQRDVKQLFLQLVDTLADVSKWGGAIGTGASDGLRILSAAGVGVELDNAGKHLDGTLYVDAAKSQQAVIKGLGLLLEKLKETQGLLNSDRQSALDLVHSLIKQQEQVRKETQQADKVNAEKLVEKQAAVRKDLGKLTQSLEQMPEAQALLEQAKAAAYDATGKIFDAKPEEAVAEQGKVLGSLAQLEQQLATAAENQGADKSAEELAQMVKDLKQAQVDMRKIEKEQEKASKSAADKLAAAQQEEQLVATDLAKVDDQRKLPEAVVSKLADAEAAAKEATAALKEVAGDKAAEAKQQQAVEKAEMAVERAASEIDAALADAKRQVQAVKIGELARAAETLERAAAAEREIAAAANDAAKDKGLDAAAAKELREEQGEVKAVVDKLAEGAKFIAPKAGESLDEAAKAVAAGEEQLKKAEQKPGEASKKAAEQAAGEANKAAEKLTAAAAEMRKEIGKAAAELAKEADAQSAEIAGAKDAVNKALDKAEQSAAERLEALGAAEKKVREAATEQQKAAGRPQAAEAMKLADKIGEVQDQQAAADDAAKDLADGKANSPLSAAAKQQEVAEQAKQVADAAAKRPQAAEAKASGKPDPVANALEKANQAAAKAAKATLDGDNTQAEAARSKAREALDDAKKLATAEAAQAAEAPAGKPDPVAQQKVSEAAAEAAKLANADAPEAGESLAQAEKASAKAQQEMKEGEPAKSAEAQAKSAESLKKAGEQIQAAMEKLGAQEAKQLAEQAGEADQLASKTAPVDPAANDAVRDAEKAAEKGAKEAAKTPKQAASGEAEVQKALERAAASLSAREQRVERDKAIAEALAQLAKEQQAAADEIAEQRATLEQAAEASKQAAKGEPAPAGKPAPKETPLATQQAAAMKLDEAADKFAQAQRATGQGAEEVSGQTEIANKPLREAMELASNLNQDDKPPAGDLPQGETPEAANGEPAASPEKGRPVSDQPSKPAPPGSKGKPATEGQPPNPGKNEGNPQPAADGGNEPAADSSGDVSDAPADTSLGTGVVPNSPEVTAELMAGQKATEQANAALGLESKANGQKSAAAKSGKPQGESSKGKESSDSKGQEASADKSKAAKPSKSPGESNGSKQEGEFARNKKVKDGAVDPAAASEKPGESKDKGGPKDSDAEARKFREESWVAKLPPELRKAIRAKGERRAPRGYEERLRRYFESID